MASNGFFAWVRRTFVGEVRSDGPPNPKAGATPQGRAIVPELRARTDDFFSPVLKALISECALDPDPLLLQCDALRQNVASGDLRALDRMLRDVLPKEPWTWPAYERWADLQGERPTRLRMVSAFGQTLARRVGAQERGQQLKNNLDRRPLWQLRVVGDAADWPACTKHDGRIERWDHEFWRSHGPQHCKQVGCRCTVRALTEAEAVPLRGAV